MLRIHELTVQYGAKRAIESGKHKREKKGNTINHRRLTEPARYAAQGYFRAHETPVGPGLNSRAQN